MAASTRRVVITGIGICTPIGMDASSFWDNLNAGKSGVHRIQGFDASHLSTSFAGEIADFDAKKHIRKEDRKSLRVMARPIQLAVSAAQIALDHSKIDKEKLDPTRFGVEFGAGLIPSELLELGPAAQISTNGQPGRVDLKAWGEKGLPAIPPLWMLKYLPNMLGCHISIMHNAQGPNNSITESDVAGLLALGEAARILRRDQSDFFLVGGADSKINPLSMVRQCLFGHLSKRNDAPEKACRPFDRKRDGMVIGEGAGVLAVEDLEHAQKRGATIWAELVGFGSAFDRGCTGTGLARAIRSALGQAGISADQLDHVNAHGLGSPHADVWEAKGLRDGLGDRPIAVWGIKGYMGHLGAGSATTEIAASLLAMKNGVLPPTLNCEDADPNCVLNVNTTSRPIARPHFLKVGFTEMGQCAAAVFKKWD